MKQLCNFPLKALALNMALLASCSSEATPGPDSSAVPLENLPPKTAPVLIEGYEQPPVGTVSSFRTDFSKRTISYSEVLSGGPPKDGIPAIDDPRFVTVADADQWLAALEPVIVVRVADEARAYPIQILMWHEIVNDELAGMPLMVSFCPLFNTAIAFERELDGRILDFGTTGRLRFSNLIMYDRQSESWWQQATGEAIAGDYAGSRLTFYPASIIAWATFKAAYPDATVLSRQTGYGRDYGNNPYLGYDDVEQLPFLYRGKPTPARLAAMARVLTLELGGEAVAFPYEALSGVKVANDMVDGQAVAVFWAGGTASALDTSAIVEGRDVGAALAYAAEAAGQVLSSIFDRGKIRDKETGSGWDILGRAVSGPLQGTRLKELPAINHFWFSWAAFRPETRIFQAAGVQ
jgi:hypothetical protein